MKTVVITGGTRGLGFELAKQFLQKGYGVVVCSTKENTTLEAVQALQVFANKASVFGKTCDVSKQAEVEELARFAEEKCGGIDIWINNAGVNQSYQYIWDIAEEEVDFLLGVDLKGAINGTKIALRHMAEKGGAIYNVEGMGSNDAFQPRFSLYGTAKRAVTYFTDATAKEIREKGLPVSIGKLSPGIMITDFLTSAKGQKGQTVLNENTKKVYNILGDKPDVIAQYLVAEILKEPKNGQRIAWLTTAKAAWRFMTSGFCKRNFFGC